MSDFRREYETLIRMKMDGLKTIQDAVTAIDKISKAIAEQTDASKRGEGSIRELKDAYAALQSIQQSIAQKGVAVGVFENTIKAAEKASERVAAAKNKYQEYANQIAQSGTATEAQQKKLDKLGDAVAKADDALTEANQKLEAQRNALKESGVQAESTDAAYKQLNDTLTQLYATRDKLAKAQQDVPQNQAEFKAQQEQLRQIEQLDKESAQRRLAADEAFAREKAAAQDKWNKSAAANYEKWWTEALNERERQEREVAALAQQSAVPSALKRSSEAAVAASKGYKTLGDEVERSRGRLLDFGRGERTTLSYLQRLRGEILALTTAYVGFNGAIQLARQSTDAFAAKQGIQNQLAISVGNDAEKIAAEYGYIREQADRIGIAFEGAAKGYAKFSAAASQAGRDQQEIRYVFEAFAEVGRVANLTTDDMNGVFKALEQIYSKGKIQAEELRGQIGDRLFGAFQIAAKALKDQFPDLDKAMKDGMVTSEQLLAIAEQYRKTVADQLPAATQSLSANQERLNSALFDFKVAIAEAGFSEAYSKLIADLTAFFQSTDGKQFAQDIAAGFSAIADGLRFLLANRDTIIAFVKTFGMLWLEIKAVNLGYEIAGVVSRIADLAKSSVLLKSFGEALAGPTGAFTVGRLAVVSFQTALGALNAFIVGWQIGSLIYEKFQEPILNATNEVVSALKSTATSLIGWLESLWIQFQGFMQKSWELVKRSLSLGGDLGKEMVSGILDLIASAVEKIPGIGTAMAESIRTAANDLRPDGQTGAELLGAFDAINAEVNAKLDANIKNTAASLAEIEKQRAAYAEAFGGSSPTGGGKPRASTGTTGTPRPPASAKAAPAPFAMDTDAYNKERIAAELEAIKNLYDEAKLSAEEYYKRRADLQIQQIDAEIALHQKALSELSPEKDEDRKRAGKELAEIKALEDKKTQIIRDAQHDRLKDEESVNKQMAELRAKVLGAEGQSVEARKQKLLAEYSDLIKRLEAEGRTADIKTIDELLGLEAAKGKLEEIQNATDNLVSGAKFKIDQIRGDNEIARSNPVLDSLVNGQQIRESIAPDLEKLKEWRTEVEYLANQGLPAAQRQLAALDKEILNLEQTGKSTFQVIGDYAIKAFGQGVGQLFDAIIDGSKTAKEALNDFARNFVTAIAKMIAQALAMQAALLLLNAIPGGSAVAQTLGLVAGVKHQGGIVGTGVTREVNPAWFANAPKFHTGGVVGFQPDEFPIIAKKNEEVLTTDDPRHRFNGGMSSASTPPVIKVVNAIDSVSMLREALSTPEGEQVLANHMQAGKTKYKTILGSK